ncbi:hypothetical protein CEXT_393571 [Caerostris extrusa]|uniref:Uncharacterized protein n=1 Tax=Caerostris extrusa TaxID=172846 RepID=A0AAV4NV49_CAEEX|nr:hypothetical protein CEXT_393571 [Caerostris extrusa]
MNKCKPGCLFNSESMKGAFIEQRSQELKICFTRSGRKNFQQDDVDHIMFLPGVVAFFKKHNVDYKYVYLEGRGKIHRGSCRLQYVSAPLKWRKILQQDDVDHIMCVLPWSGERFFNKDNVDLAHCFIPEVGERTLNKDNVICYISFHWRVKRSFQQGDTRR